MNLADVSELYSKLEKDINENYENVYESQKEPKILEKLIEQVPDDVLPKEILDAYSIAAFEQMSKMPYHSQYTEEGIRELASAED